MLMLESLQKGQFNQNYFSIRMIIVASTHHLVITVSSPIISFSGVASSHTVCALWV